MRQRFDHLVEEISLAVRAPVPRYRLWLRLHEHGCDPERITARMAVAFCAGPLKLFLAEEGLRLGPMARRRLVREVRDFQPSLLRTADGLAESE